MKTWENCSDRLEAIFVSSEDRFCKYNYAYEGH